jgi:hypothetical protein
MAIDEAVVEAIPALLRQNQLLVGVTELPLERSLLSISLEPRAGMHVGIHAFHPRPRGVSVGKPLPALRPTPYLATTSLSTCHLFGFLNCHPRPRLARQGQTDSVGAPEP